MSVADDDDDDDDDDVSSTNFQTFCKKICKLKQASTHLLFARNSSKDQIFQVHLLLN